MFPLSDARGASRVDSDNPNVMAALSVVQQFLDMICIPNDKDNGQSIKPIDNALRKLVFFKVICIFNWYGCLYSEYFDDEIVPRRLYINGNTILQENPALLFSRPIDDTRLETHERVFYDGPCISTVYDAFVTNLAPWGWFAQVRCFPTDPVNLAMIRATFFGPNAESIMAFPRVHLGGRRPFKIGTRSDIIVLGIDKNSQRYKSDVHVVPWDKASSDMCVHSRHFFDIDRESLNVCVDREQMLGSISDGRVPMCWPIVKILASQLKRHGDSGNDDITVFNENSKADWKRLTSAQWDCIEFGMGCLGITLGVYVNSPFFLFMAGAPGVGKTVLASWVSRILGPSNVFNFDVSDTSKHAMSGITAIESDGRIAIKPLVNFPDLQQPNGHGGGIPSSHSGTLLALVDLGEGSVIIDAKHVQKTEVFKDGPVRAMACSNAAHTQIFPGDVGAFSRRATVIPFPYEVCRVVECEIIAWVLISILFTGIPRY